MTELFLAVLNRSLTAGVLILVIVLVRLIFRRAPKWLLCALWALVAVRLVCPVSLESALSLLPSAQPVQAEILTAQTPGITSGIAVIDAAVNPPLAAAFTPAPEASVNPLQIVAAIGAWVWALGAAGLCVYGLGSALRLRLRVRAAVRLEGCVYQSEFVDTPFILGVVRPRIYLPYRLQEDERALVLAHERAHLRRGDQLWKPLGYMLLAVYWFQPLCWLAYRLLCRDIERACDEKVVRELGEDCKAAYSRALLACSVPRRQLGANPLAFGEQDVKSRIRAVLRYKRPALWLAVAALAVGIVVAVGFLTDPKKPETEKTAPQPAQTETEIPAPTTQQSGLYASMGAYAEAYLQNVALHETVQGGKAQQARISRLEQLAELSALAPEGELELWRFSYELLPAQAAGGDYVSGSTYLLTALRNGQGQYQILRAAVDDGTVLAAYETAGNLSAYLNDVYVVYAGAQTGKYYEPAFVTMADGSGCAAFYTVCSDEYYNWYWGLYVPTQGWTRTMDFCRWACDGKEDTFVDVNYGGGPLFSLVDYYRDRGYGSELTRRGEVISVQTDGCIQMHWLYPEADGCFEVTISWREGDDDSAALLQKIAQSFTVLDENGQQQTDLLLAWPYGGIYELRTEVTVIPCPDDVAGCTERHTRTRLVSLDQETGERTVLDERVDTLYWYMCDIPASNLNPQDQCRVGAVGWRVHQDGYCTEFLDIDVPQMTVKVCTARGSFTLSGPEAQPPEDESQIMPNGVYPGMDYETTLALATAHSSGAIYRGREPGDNFTVDGVSYYFGVDEEGVLRLRSTSEIE